VAPRDCPACGEDDHEVRFHIPPRIIAGCHVCGHEYVVSPLPDQNPVHYSFRADEADSINTDIDLGYLLSVFQRYGLVGCRLLDVGAGHGRVESRLLRLGWPPDALHVVDVDPNNVCHLQRVAGLKNARREDASRGLHAEAPYNCILMIEFLEHVWSPFHVLRSAAKALVPGGLLIVRAVPNVDSLEAWLASDRWKLRSIESHLGFFSRTSMQRLIARVPGLEIIEWGCFLQPGFRFFDWRRVARNIGILPNATAGTEQDLQRTLLKRLAEAPLHQYPNFRALGPEPIEELRTVEDVGVFFDRINLNFQVSPDLGAVIRKR
jgi:2-polyprenyl-3-methyl-5-hydroxy-6-metoxy-1,4-benzoquinol methylase